MTRTTKKNLDVPVHGPYGQVEKWLRATGAGEVLEDAVFSPVFSEQSFEPGAPSEAELRELWPAGGWMCWLGGPAVAPLEQWPRRADGKALAHVASIHLGVLDATTDAVGKAGWPEGQLREGLPTEGVLEVFHDLESFGYDPAEGAARSWLVRWVKTPDHSVLIDPPQDLDTPTEVCQLCLPLPGFTLPSAADAASGPQDRFDLVESLELSLQNGWLAQRTGSSPEVPIPFSHAYGHSHHGRIAAVEDILPGVLPLEPGDEYRLILDLESWTALAGWFGDAGNLEIWIRESDLQARAFERAWCLIRTD
ncbi:DUF1963 domain-containing protein [Arthrobacter antioxidans]|uniref:DUF1963 domain-containing protein n=1 Tax=Arthrobacter antioxidans TaxID=2895818 RepID=UPI001FFF7F7A|nr:DUF1963 domain-containing protein [Arthrobacter antioxidans]